MDEHVPPAVTNGLRLRGVDVITIQDAGMLRSSDEALLNFALSRGRVIFSHDEYFLVLHQRGYTHAGNTYAPQQSSIGDLVRGLLLIHAVQTAEEMRGHFEFL